MAQEHSDKLLQPGTSSSETNEDKLTDRVENRYVNDLRQGLRSTRDDRVLCDVIVIVDGHRFQCHKLVLCIFSGFFNSMFNSGMKECHENEIELKSVSADIFEIILNYLYTGVLKEIVKIRELLATSLYLQIKSLSDACQEVLCYELNLNSAIELWRIANNHGNACEIMTRGCQDWMLDNFKYYYNDDECFTLFADEVKFLVSHGSLLVKSEDDVCDFVINWIQADFDNRKQYVNDIFKHVRLPLVKRPLLKRVGRYAELNDNDQLSKSLLDAEHYKKRPAKQCHVNTLHTEPRRRSLMEKGIIVISGGKDYDFVDRCREVWFYSFQASKWHRLPRLPNMEHGFATCTYGRSTVCVTGGAESSKCYKYNGTGSHNKWKSFDNMEEERAGHGLIAINKSIYAIGGMQLDYSVFLGRKTLSSIEKFDTFTKCWDFCGDLVFDVVDVAVSAIGNILYIFPPSFCINNDIQSFDVSTRTASVIKHSESLNDLRCVCSDDEFYLITTENKNVYIKSFSPGEESLITVQEFAVKEKIEAFECVKWGSKLYIFGGVSNSLLQSTIFEYDVQTKSLREFEDQLPFPLYEFGCHVLTVKKEYYS